MRPVRIAAVLAVLGMLSSVSMGQEPAPAQPAPAASPPAAQSSENAGGAAPVATQAPAGKIPSAAPAAGSPATPRAPSKDEEFIPSEEVSADEEITFPVGI